MCHSVQPWDWIFVKGYGFLSFANNMGKNVGKNIIKNLSSKYNQSLLDCAKQSATDGFKTASKRAIQKTAEAMVIWLVIKLLTELCKFQKIHNKIFQNQFQMTMIKKYLKKDIYLQKKTRYYW